MPKERRKDSFSLAYLSSKKKQATIKSFFTSQPKK